MKKPYKTFLDYSNDSLGRQAKARLAEIKPDSEFWTNVDQAVIEYQAKVETNRPREEVRQEIAYFRMRVKIVQENRERCARNAEDFRRKLISWSEWPRVTPIMFFHPLPVAGKIHNNNPEYGCMKEWTRAIKEMITAAEDGIEEEEEDRFLCELEFMIIPTGQEYLALDSRLSEQIRPVILFLKKIGSSDELVEHAWELKTAMAELELEAEMMDKKDARGKSSPDKLYETTKLSTFVEKHCKLNRDNDVQALCTCIRKAVSDKRISYPPFAKKGKGGRAHYFYGSDLIQRWETWQKAIPSLPPLSTD